MSDKITRRKLLTSSLRAAAGALLLRFDRAEIAFSLSSQTISQDKFDVIVIGAGIAGLAYPATVHGAFLSGEREARRISNL